jgi:uncharacterized membrane protein
MEYTHFIEWTSRFIEVSGVIMIVTGIATSTAFFFVRSKNLSDGEKSYKTYRQDIGRSILLGLEFLIAADIIRSVAVSPSFTTVGVLGIIVLIRSFLSMELTMEIEGRWPWQARKS